MPADVVDFADFAFAQNQINRGAVVFDVQPVADVGAGAVDGQFFIAERVDNHQRD